MFVSISTVGAHFWSPAARQRTATHWATEWRACFASDWGCGLAVERRGSNKASKLVFAESTNAAKKLCSACSIVGKWSTECYQSGGGGGGEYKASKRLSVILEGLDPATTSFWLIWVLEAELYVWQSSQHSDLTSYQPSMCSKAPKPVQSYASQSHCKNK